MKLELYKYAVMKSDLKKHKLKAGDLVMPIEYYPKKGKIPAHYVIEVFGLNKKTIGVFTIEDKFIQAIKEDLRITTRAA